jgi:hypothetical protein
MKNAATPFYSGPDGDNSGCAYPMETEGKYRFCGTPRQPGSP